MESGSKSKYLNRTMTEQWNLTFLQFKDDMKFFSNVNITHWHKHEKNKLKFLVRNILVQNLNVNDIHVYYTRLIILWLLLNLWQIMTVPSIFWQRPRGGQSPNWSIPGLVSTSTYALGCFHKNLVQFICIIIIIITLKRDRQTLDYHLHHWSLSLALQPLLAISRHCISQNLQFWDIAEKSQ